MIDYHTVIINAYHNFDKKETTVRVNRVNDRKGTGELLIPETK